MAKKSARRSKGDGSFSFNEKTKVWQYRLTIPGQYDKNGKTVRKAVYGKTKEECRRKMKEIVNMYETGTVYSSHDLTIYLYGKY